MLLLWESVVEKGASVSDQEAGRSAQKKEEACLSRVKRASRSMSVWARGIGPTWGRDAAAVNRPEHACTGPAWGRAHDANNWVSGTAFD